MALRRHQFDFYFAPERSSRAVQCCERDRGVLRIEQAVNGGTRCSHACSHRALVYPLLFHQVIHFQRDSALERGRVHFLVQALFF